MEKIKQITEFWHFFYLIWADGAATKRPKSEENNIFLGGAVHFWRFTWQKIFLKKIMLADNLRYSEGMKRGP